MYFDEDCIPCWQTVSVAIGNKPKGKPNIFACRKWRWKINYKKIWRICSEWCVCPRAAQLLRPLGTWSPGRSTCQNYRKLPKSRFLQVLIQNLIKSDRNLSVQHSGRNFTTMTNITLLENGRGLATLIDSILLLMGL